MSSQIENNSHPPSTSLEHKQNTIVEIIAIGREILDGRVIDTNSSWIGLELAKIGIIPRYAQKTDDHKLRIIESFKIAESRSNLIFVTGGLGPTSDDLTIECFAEFLSEPLVTNEEAKQQIQSFFNKRGIQTTAVQLKQALTVNPCKILRNPEGSAPGFLVQRKKISWIFFPGVPRELKSIFLTEVLPLIPNNNSYESFTWATQFTSEGKLQEDLTEIEKKLPQNFELTYRTQFPENHIGLHGNCITEDLKSQFNLLKKEIDHKLGATVFSKAQNRDTLFSLEEVTLNALINKNTVLGTAESCTGGLVANRITNISGASAAFWGSALCYDNSAKQKFLNVTTASLQNYGAVSVQVAEEMAKGLLEQILQSSFTSKNLITLSTTGIAGPSGGTAEKPVGLCFLGLAFFDAEKKVSIIKSKKILARPGLSRDQYKTYFSQQALEFVRTFLKEL